MNDRNNEQADGLKRVTSWIDGNSDLSSAPSNTNDNAGTSADDALLAEQLLMNSLLQGRFESEDDRTSRLQSALKRFDQLEPGDDLTPKTPTRKLMYRSPQAVASLAAMLLAAVAIWMLATPKSANAAMQQVIKSFEANAVRVYKGDVKGRWFGVKRELQCTLRSCGSDKFVVQMHNTLIQPNAMGSDGEERWTVSGNRTWRSSEGKKEARDALIDRMTSLNLEINRLIIDIPANYKLKLLAPTPLPGADTMADSEADSVQCYPIEAVRIGNDTLYPDLVRVWPHPRTGVVARMEIIRERGEGRTPTHIDLLLTGEEPVDGDLFRPEHYLK